MLTTATASDSERLTEEDYTNEFFEEEEEEDFGDSNMEETLESMENFAKIVEKAKRLLIASKKSTRAVPSGPHGKDDLEVIAAPLDVKGKDGYLTRPTVVNSGNEPFEPYPFGIVGYSYKEVIAEIQKESNLFVLVGKRKSGKQYGRPNDCGDTKDILWVSYNPSFYGQYIWLSSHVVHIYARKLFNIIKDVKLHIVKDWKMLQHEAIFIENTNPEWNVKELSNLDPQVVNALDDTEIRKIRQSILDDHLEPFNVPGATVLNDDEIKEQLDEWLEDFDTTAADHSYLVEAKRVKDVQMFSGVLSQKPEQVERTAVVDNTAVKYLALLFKKARNNPHYSTINWDTPGYLTCNEVPSLKFYLDRWPELTNLFKYLASQRGTSATKNLHIALKGTRGKTAISSSVDDMNCGAVSIMKSNLPLFFTTVLFGLNLPLLKSWIHLITFPNVSFYLNTVSSPTKLNYTNPNTARFKTGMFWGVLAYIKTNNRMSFTDHEHFDRIHKLVNVIHQQVSKERDMTIKSKHCISYLIRVGQYIPYGQWSSCLEHCVKICTNWISMWKDGALEEETKKNIIYKYGLQFHDACSWILFHLSYFNRGEVYSQCTISNLVCNHVIPIGGEVSEFIQFYLAFNGKEKVFRSMME